MNASNQQSGAIFSKIIEEDEEVPLENIKLINDGFIIYEGNIGDTTWICVHRINGG